MVHGGKREGRGLSRFGLQSLGIFNTAHDCAWKSSNKGAEKILVAPTLHVQHRIAPRQPETTIPPMHVDVNKPGRDIRCVSQAEILDFGGFI